MTPELYFPCRSCGLWSRQHVGVMRKCMFQASCFEPKWPREFSAAEREATIERLERLTRQLVGRRRRKADALEQEIDKIHSAACAGCRHINDAGVVLLDRRDPYAGQKYHVICSLCGEDWYEDEEGRKLHPEGAVGSGE